jgi:hypothetical protein
VRLVLEAYAVINFNDCRSTYWSSCLFNHCGYCCEALKTALGKSHEQVVTLLLNAGSSVNKVSDECTNALLDSCRRSHVGSEAFA